MLSPADHIAQLEYVVREQMTEIDRLRAGIAALKTENRRLQDWIMGEGPDALVALQKVYSDPNTPMPEIIKSATSALPFERAKPVSTSVVIDWKEYTRSIRLRQEAKDRARWAAEDAAKVIEHQPQDPEPAA
jgi:hypothetical protein